MRRKLSVFWFGLGVATSAPLFGGEGIKQPVEVTSNERVNFAPGGTVHMNGSYGHLNVEGWDQAAVEITVTKSLEPDYVPEQQERVKQRLERVRVGAERHSDTDLAVLTVLPLRGGHLSPPFRRTTKAGVLLDYTIYVPRDTRLIIHHGKGYVSVSGVTGDIETTVSSGDIVLMLPGSDSHTIDAKCRIGRVDSDLTGTAHMKYLLGKQFDRANQTGTRRIRLRVGFGGITIKQVPPESEPPVASNVPQP
jgi:hypothetical protein